MDNAKLPRYRAAIPQEDGSMKKYEFESPDDTCALALSDAQGWTLQGRIVGDVLQRVIRDDEPAPKPTPKPATIKPKPKNKKTMADYVARGPGNSNRMMSMAQIKTLCQLAKSAFDHMDKYGLIEGVSEKLSKSARCDAWRKLITKEVTGKDSMKKCTNADYRRIEAEFLKLGGKKYANPKAYQTGQQSHRKEDTTENREQAIYLINKQLSTHQMTMKEHGQEAEQVTEGYILSIARAQHKDAALADYDCLITLPAYELEKLFFTTRNRCNSKEKRFIKQ